MSPRRDANGRFIAGSGGSSSAFRFDPDAGGIRDLLTGRPVADLLTETARNARELVLKYAPSDPDDFFRYRSSVRYVPAQTVSNLDDMFAAVGSDSPGWHLVEFGTVRYPARAPIRRGVQESGIELDRFYLFA